MAWDFGWERTTSASSKMAEARTCSGSTSASSSGDNTFGQAFVHCGGAANESAGYAWRRRVVVVVVVAIANAIAVLVHESKGLLKEAWLGGTVGHGALEEIEPIVVHVDSDERA